MSVSFCIQTLLLYNTFLLPYISPQGLNHRATVHSKHLGLLLKRYCSVTLTGSHPQWFGVRRALLRNCTFGTKTNSRVMKSVCNTLGLIITIKHHTKLVLMVKHKAPPLSIYTFVVVGNKDVDFCAWDRCSLCQFSCFKQILLTKSSDNFVHLNKYFYTSFKNK